MTYSSEVLADSPLGYWRLGQSFVTPSAATASSTFFASDPAGAIDADGISVWVTNGVVAAWLRLQYPTATALTQYRIRREDNASFTPRMPKDWTFEGSNDGSSWTVLDTRTGVTWPTVGETKTFSFSNSTAYTYYRINITANSGDASYTQVNELITSVAVDASGNGRDMVPVGTITSGATGLLASDSDHAISLAGTGHLRIPDYSSWMSPSAVTVEAIIKTSSTALMSIVDRDESAARAFQFRLNAGKLEFISINGGAGTVSAADTTNLADGVAHHVAATYDASNIKLYVDGVLVKTQAAVGALSTQGAKLSISANFSGGGASARFSGTIDEVAYYGTALSGTRIAAHAAEVNPSTSVTINAPVLTATSDVLAPTVGGTASVVAPLLSGVSDMLDPTIIGGGNLDIVAPVIEATSDVLDPTVDIVSNISVDAPTLAAVSDVLAPTVTGGSDVSVVAPVLAGMSDALNPTVILDSAEGVDLGIRLGLEVSDQVVTFDTETVDVDIRLGLEVSDVVIHAIETVNLGIGLGLRTYTPKVWGEDVRTGRPSPRIDIAERDGTLVATLPASTIGRLGAGVNVMDKFSFTVDRVDDRARVIDPVKHEALLWRGDVLMSRGPIGPGRSDDARTAYDCADPRWYFADGRRRIGRIPKRQLLLNPGFTDGAGGLAHWVGGWDDGSALESAPEAEVVAESYARSGKALELAGVDKIMRGTETLETAAVFRGNRPYAWEPLANGFLPGGEAAITAIADMMTGPAPVVHITGHTADADSGDGQALSERRALAAKAVVLARWPAAVITTEGKGETEPVDKSHTEAAYKKNRRVVFEFDTNISAVGHRQFYREWVTVTQPTSAKVPLPLTFAADMRIIEWLGAPGDGWAILIRAKRGSTVIDEANATMDEFTPRVRWAHYEATIEIPADGIATSVDVRLYPPAGSSRWANAGLWPQDQLGFFDVDQALIVKGIVEHVQDTTLGHGDLGIGTRTPVTGIPRTREYPYHERMPADTALEWFTSIDKGMDLDFDQVRRQIVTHYPRQGTSTDLALVHGGRRSNVVAYKPLSSSSLTLASNVIMQADGSGASRPEGYARDAAALGGALLESVVSAEEDTPLSELDEGAAATLAASLRARPGWELTLDPDFTTEFLNRVDKGDTLRLVLPDEDVDGPHRLVYFEWDPESDVLTVTLVEEEA